MAKVPHLQFISSILRKAGYKTGLYLSPYVYDMRERIQIDGQMISEEDFADIITRLQPVIDEISASDLGEVTEFEVKTMAAFMYMEMQKVDFAVLEVGMGGRFDATNIAEPLVSVITNISLDHTERLGNTIKKIAFEKSGIIKTGGLLVTAVQDQQAWLVILDRCRHMGSEVWRVISSEHVKTAVPSADMHLRYTSKGDHFSFRQAESVMINIKPGLMGEFQQVNASTAIAAVLALKKYEIRIPEKTIIEGISSAYLPGRLETLRYNPRLVIDGAHNPDAARNLAVAIHDNFRYDNLILVIGMLENHSARGVLSIFGSISVYCNSNAIKMVKSCTCDIKLQMREKDIAEKWKQ